MFDKDPINPDLIRLRAEYARRRETLDTSDRYSLLNRAHLFMIQQRQRVFLDLLAKHHIRSFAEKRVLEIGCGMGGVLLEYLSYGVQPRQLHGVELLQERLDCAATKLRQLPLACADAQRLPYASATFDFVIQYTVFSSILDVDLRMNIAQEMLRVVRNPGGIVIWYDFWTNPTNPQTRGIRPTEIRQLFPGCRYDFQRVTLAPPLTRLLVNLSWGAAYLLEKLKVFNTHYFVLIRPVTKP